MIDTNNLVVGFGKYKGELWTRVPISYLQWLTNEKETPKGLEGNKEIALAEIRRRGTKVSHEVEISPHAVDKASLRLRRIWHETSNEGEGLYSWLSRVATGAIKVKGKSDVVEFLGIKFVFKIGKNYPILKTVMPLKIKNYDQETT